MTSTSTGQRLPSEYWRLLTASGISNLGDGIFIVALPLLAARLSGDAIGVSLVAAAAVMPWLIFSLPIGAIIDRYDRKQIMVITDTARAVMVGLLAVAVALDVVEIWMLWVLALGLGTAEVFFDSASQAMLPAVVPAPLLEKANGRKYSVDLTTNTFLGAPLGSLLFGVSVALPFGVDAASFAIAVILVIGVRGKYNPNTAPRHETASLYAEMRTGMRWLWKQPLLRSIALSLALSNLAFQMPQAVFVLFAREELGVGETGFGFLLAVMGAGAIVGGLVGDRIVNRFGQTQCIYGAICTWVVTLLAVPIYPQAWFVAVAVAIESLAATVWNVVTISLRQQAIPDQLFGRVNGVYRWLAWGTLPIGSIIGGQVAYHLGLRANYFVAAGVMVVAVLVLVRHVNTAGIVRALSANRVATGLDDTPVARRDPLFD
ncbi:MAG: MFS transporter [Actinobacteria bacterium]|nr:MFS transporter [Actinomycetota bacterium]